MEISELLTKWNTYAEQYKTVEIGDGVHDFVNDVFSHPELFALKLTPKKTTAIKTFVHDTEADKHGRPDFVLYISKNVTIPCEVKCFGHITEGLKQLKRYQLDYVKEYGILTDGFEWRFYRAHSYQVLTIEQILADPAGFGTFWNNYLKPENYYAELFLPTGQGILFDEPLGLNDAENRSIFFKDTSKIIGNFRTKISIADHKTAIETAYAYLIQFIMYKVLVDNRFQKFENDYRLFRRQVVEAIRNKDLYNLVVFNIRNISEYIAKNVYRPFAAEQQSINEKLIADLSRELEIEDIAPWLDIIEFINKYDFANLRNEIFGFVYENYLKDLYGEKNRGQYFTAPEIVNFMLDELGYNEESIKQNPDNISIIDPACGAGTFLYSAADRIIRALDTKGSQDQATQIKELIEKNVFGLDIAEFPLYLAELCILVDLLPLIVNDRFVQPVSHKLKLFKTRDSISEFLETGISTQNVPLDLFTHLKETALDYQSFMRDDENLSEMLLSMQGVGKERLRFDYVVANPPYIGYNECAKRKFDFIKKIQDPKNTSLTMGNVFGVNLNTVPGRHKKNTPKPNLYAFFIALGQALLKEGGKMSFIIPQNVLQSRDLDVIRYHLANAMTIEKIITFEANLFIRRGLAQNKTVATSSLIFVVTKKPPRANHKVRIVNYRHYTEKQKGDFGLYLKSRNKEIKTIEQTELLRRFENWNYIKENETFALLLEHYQKHSLSIEEYRRDVLQDYDDVCFDAGYDIDERKLSAESEYYRYPQIDKRFYSIRSARGYWAKHWDIKLLRANQGHRLLSMRYKILWRYNNPSRFHFTEDNVISSRNNIYYIGSNDKKELLFLFALLNASLNGFLLRKLLQVAHEKSLLISLSSIKDYVRIPKITAKNNKLKDKIITLTESLLALENVVHSDNIDFELQTDIKKQIDDLVFALYFDVPPEEAEQHEFYRLLYS